MLYGKFLREISQKCDMFKEENQEWREIISRKNIRKIMSAKSTWRSATFKL
jgi:hypothetical protein